MRKRNLFMSATLMCVFFIIAFKFGEGGVKWFWTGQEIVPIILGVSALILGGFVFFENRKIKIKNK